MFFEMTAILDAILDFQKGPEGLSGIFSMLLYSYFVINVHLSNTTAYLKLEPKSYDPNVILKEYLDLIFELKKYLSKKQYNWLIGAPNEVGIMYGLPKIHKENHPIRPIASQIKCLTNRLHIDCIEHKGCMSNFCQNQCY